MLVPGAIMAFILRSTRLLYNFVGFTRQANRLAGRKEKFIFEESQRILNFNQLTVRTIALSPEEKEDSPLNNHFRWTDLDKLIHQLNLDVGKRRVFKNSIEKVYEGLKESGVMTDSQVMLLLKCCTDVSFMCSEKERIQLAQDIWNTAVNFGIKFDETHYNALLAVYVANNHNFSYRKFLDKMKKAGVNPNIITYKCLLRGSCQQGNINVVKELLDDMKSLNYGINENDFNSLILGYSVIGDFEKVDEIFKIMKEKNIEISSKSYVNLLCGYIQHENFEKFQEILDMLSEKNISLSEADYLQIIETLAVKKQENLIDVVLNRIPKTSNCYRLLTNLIQRLLHKKLDSVALKLLHVGDSISSSFYYDFSTTKYFLDHYLQYRQPSEVLKACEELEKRGITKTGLNYSLKKVFLAEDENIILKFIHEMKARNIPIREHYHWPIIIKASSKGNEHMLAVVKKLPIGLCNRLDSVFNVILKNYKFGESWKTDFENLEKVGISKSNLVRHFMAKFLEENEIDLADQISTANPVRTFKLKHILNVLFGSLAQKPDKVEQAVNIVYSLCHDVCLSSLDEDAQNAEPDISTPQITKYLDFVVASLLNNCENEEIILLVLEEMLKKKIGISSEAGASIIESFPSQKFEELVGKLTDPNLKVELNQSLLNQKKTALDDAGLDFIKSPKHCIACMLRLARDKKFDKAIQVGEYFVERNTDLGKENASVKVKTNFIHLLNKFSGEKNWQMTEKIFDFGMKLGILTKSKRNDYGLLLIHELKCRNISKAFETFKEYVLKTGKFLGATELLMECISEGRTDTAQQITEFITENRNKNAAVTHLVIALTAVGEVDKAKKLLDSAEVRFLKSILFQKLIKWQNVKSTDTIENFIKVFKNLHEFNDGLTLLFKILIKKYAIENNIDKIKMLWLEVQELGITDQEFLNQLSEFQENPNVERLIDSLNISFKKNESNSKKNLDLNVLNQILGKSDIEEKYLLAINGKLKYQETVHLAVKFASKGNVERAFLLAEKYSMRKSVRKIAAAFLTSENPDAYFQFLDLFASKEEFSFISDCFRVGSLIPVLQLNDELFKKYKSLTLQCADETHFSKPVISCFVTCVKLPGKLADAEEVIEKYSNYFKNVPISEINEAVEMAELSKNFYENILSSVKLKNHFLEHLHVFYNKLITLNCEENKLEDALHYLNLAINDGVKKELLEGSSIPLLKEKLKEQGQSFSYPNPSGD